MQSDEQFGKLRRVRMKLRLAAYMLVARAKVRLMPARTLREREDQGTESRTISESELDFARRVGRYIDQTLRRLPVEVLCLPQAMAGRWYLLRHGIPSRIVIGARNGTKGKPFDLHAWLMVGDECILGDTEVDTFAPFDRPGTDGLAS